MQRGQVNIPSNILIESTSNAPPAHTPCPSSHLLPFQRRQSLHSTWNVHLKVPLGELSRSVLQTKPDEPGPPRLLVSRPLLHSDRVYDRSDDVQYFGVVARTADPMKELRRWFDVLCRKDLREKVLRNLICRGERGEGKPSARHLPSNILHRIIWV